MEFKLQGVGYLHRQINKDPILNKSAESKCPNYLLQSFGAITLYLKRKIKTNARKEIGIESARALDPLKIRLEFKLIND